MVPSEEGSARGLGLMHGLARIGLALAAWACVCHAPAALADVYAGKFGASVSNSCTLISVSDGLMVQNTPRNTLSSIIPGGVPARVTANTSAAGFNISTIAPFFFSTSPPAQFAFFQSSYSVSGATSTGSVAGATQTRLNGGSNTVRVNLEAFKIIGNFASGNYTAVVTVRCE